MKYSSKITLSLVSKILLFWFHVVQKKKFINIQFSCMGTQKYLKNVLYLSSADTPNLIYWKLSNSFVILQTIEMIEKEQREVERRPITKITHKGEIEIESQEPVKVPEPVEVRV